MPKKSDDPGLLSPKWKAQPIHAVCPWKRFSRSPGCWTFPFPNYLKTDRAQIPANLMNRLVELFGGEANEQLFEQKFGETEVTLFRRRLWREDTKWRII